MKTSNIDEGGSWTLYSEYINRYALEGRCTDGNLTILSSPLPHVDIMLQLNQRAHLCPDDLYTL